MKRKPTPEEVERMWPCACVKRDRRGNMTAIKLHSPFVKKCRACGVLRDVDPQTGLHFSRQHFLERDR